MVEIFGKYYYIDFDRITEKCGINKRLTESVDEVEEETQTINIFKYELIKMCIERILTEDTDIDENLGAFASNGLTISFKVAFNTLIKNEILIENKEEDE